MASPRMRVKDAKELGALYEWRPDMQDKKTARRENSLRRKLFGRKNTSGQHQRCILLGNGIEDGLGIRDLDLIVADPAYAAQDFMVAPHELPYTLNLKDTKAMRVVVFRHEEILEASSYMKEKGYAAEGNGTINMKTQWL